MGRPVLVDVQTVRGTTRDEVLELDVPDVSGAQVALDHESLITTVGVNVPVKDVLDSSAIRETANGATTRLVAPNCGNLSMAAIGFGVLRINLLRSTRMFVAGDWKQIVNELYRLVKVRNLP